MGVGPLPAMRGPTHERDFGDGRKLYTFVYWAW
jgi:hypothetical protein